MRTSKNLENSRKMPYASPTARTVSLYPHQSALLNLSGVSNNDWSIDTEEYEW